MLRSLLMNRQTKALVIAVATMKVVLMTEEQGLSVTEGVKTGPAMIITRVMATEIPIVRTVGLDKGIGRRLEHGVRTRMKRCRRPKRAVLGRPNDARQALGWGMTITFSNLAL